MGKEGIATDIEEKYFCLTIQLYCALCSTTQLGRRELPLTSRRNTFCLMKQLYCAPYSTKLLVTRELLPTKEKYLKYFLPDDTVVLCAV